MKFEMKADDGSHLHSGSHGIAASVGGINPAICREVLEECAVRCGAAVGGAVMKMSNLTDIGMQSVVLCVGYGDDGDVWGATVRECALVDGLSAGDMVSFRVPCVV